MIGVTWFGDTDSYDEFVTRHGLTFPQLRDDDGTKVFGPLGVTGQPAFAFIDTDGTGQLVLGALGPDRIDAAVEAMLAD